MRLWFLDDSAGGEAAVPCVASCALRAGSSVRNYRNYSETIVICNDVNVRNLAFVTGMAVRSFGAGEL